MLGLPAALSSLESVEAAQMAPKPGGLKIEAHAKTLGVEVRIRQSNIEGEIINFVQDAIAVQENGSREGIAQRSDSHFVSACLTFGCETRRCQTTA